MATAVPFNLEKDAFFRAFKNEFERKVRKHLEDVVLHLSKPIVDKAIREVTDHMQVALRENWRNFNTEFCVLITDERTNRKEG